MKKYFLLFIFLLPMIAMAQQAPAGSTDQYPVRVDEAIPVHPAAAPSSGDEDKVYTMAEVMPEFPGGQNALFAFLGKNIQYPADALESKKQGTVYVSFVVNTDGKVTDVKMLRGLHPSLDKEAMRVVSRMPNWTPGMQNGKPVKTQYNLPVKFLLR